MGPEPPHLLLRYGAADDKDVVLPRLETSSETNCHIVKQAVYVLQRDENGLSKGDKRGIWHI